MSRTTRLIAVDPDNPDPAAIEEAASVLRAGGLVAFPTETVYGLGADATSAEAVGRIFQAKGRPPSNPLIVHVDSLAMAVTCVRTDVLSPVVSALWERWWPGPVTFVVEKSERIPGIVSAGSGTVGLRMPRSAVALALIRALGRPIAAPSANRSTGISPTRAWHVLKDLDGRIDLILDGGPTSVGLESTVVDMTRTPPRVLRVGPVPREEFEPSEGVARQELAGVTEGASSPGQSRVHYAPRIPTFWVEAGQVGGFHHGGRGGLIVVGADQPVFDQTFERRVRLDDPTTAGIRLYEVLHELEDAGLDYLVVVPPPDFPDWEAVRDRLHRASRPPDPSGSIE